MGRAEDLFARLKIDGVRAIDEFITTRASEELFLDFKRSADDGKGRSLHQNDANNLSKMISAFGNSSGGVVVWGVECSKDRASGADVATAKHPLQDVPKFVSLLQSAVSGRSLPAHPTVQHHGIALPGGSMGFVATLIPETTLAPLQSVFDSRYYIRVGSDCLPAPHGVLAGMFGRKPVPNLFLVLGHTPPRKGQGNAGPFVEFQSRVMLMHKTPAVARDVYLSTNLPIVPGPACNAEWSADESGHWVASNAFGARLSLFCGDQFKLPPEMLVRPLTVKWRFSPPFTGPLKTDFWFGCAGSPIKHIEVRTEASVMEDAWKRYVEGSPANPPDDFALTALPLPASEGSNVQVVSAHRDSSEHQRISNALRSLRAEVTHNKAILDSEKDQKRVAMETSQWQHFFPHLHLLDPAVRATLQGAYALASRHAQAVSVELVRADQGPTLQGFAAEMRSKFAEVLANEAWLGE